LLLLLFNSTLFFSWWTWTQDEKLQGDIAHIFDYGRTWSIALLGCDGPKAICMWHTHTHYGQPRHGGWKLMTTPLPVRERKLRLACPRQFIANLQAPIPIPITLGILLSSKKIFAQTSSSHRILQGLVILGGYPNTCSIVPLCNSWNCLLAIVLPDRCIRSPHFWDLLTYHPIPS
jgi:hypothetical protein